jgi:phosphoserine aminotransferase
VVDRTRQVLEVPDSHLIGIVAASDTGAVEMAMWSLLGSRPIDVLVWESFSKGWASDILDHLKLDDVRTLGADYGELPDLGRVDFSRDVVFAWNGTTSGVRVPDGDWIADERAGLTICDATSAAFAMALPWSKLDVVTYSWQKVLGGEAQHGILILGPRAVERLESHTPPWPLPKIFRLTKHGKLNRAIFEGVTINTPSLLAVEDYLDVLEWARGIGGLEAMIARTNENAAVIGEWVERTDWVEFLASEPSYRSTTSVCLKIVDSWFVGLDEPARKAVQREIVTLLENEAAAFDIEAYRDAPAGLRLWAGATVERRNLEALFPWLDWAFAEIKARHKE